jgi:hypothetical protein
MVKSGIGLAGRGVPGAGHLSLSVAVAFDSRTGHFFSQVAFASAAETPHASQVLRLASAVLHFESHCAVARVVSMDVNPRVMTMIPAIVQKAPVIVPTPHVRGVIQIADLLANPIVTVRPITGDSNGPDRPIRIMA